MGMNIYEDEALMIAQAIVIKAVQDYKKAKKKLSKKPNSEQAQWMINEVEGFFKSKWFTTLTGLEGSAVLKRLERETDNMLKQGKTKKGSVTSCDFL